MTTADSERLIRHVRTRRVKRVLRLLPRKAVLHRYPLIGRFAAVARRRAHLWSFRQVNVRPALYFGSIVSLWPIMGVQLPLAFLLCLAFRANFMVAGGLQFITNPITAAPIYYGTYRTGKWLLEHSGWTQRIPEHVPTEALATDALPAHVDKIQGFTGVALSLLVGGVVCGLALAVVLDVIYVCSARIAAARKPR